jgi:uncharacterized repeat protein (TIGR01451 family)
VRRIRSLVVVAAIFATLVVAGSASARPLAAAPPTFTVTPSSAARSVGETHTVTANVTQPTGAPYPDQTVNFSVTAGPNTGLSATKGTDASGNATFAYSSSKAGTDTITVNYPAWQMTKTVTVTWSIVRHSDPKLTMSAPGFVRVGRPAAFTAVVSNGGPDTTTGVELRATIPSGATLVSASSTVGSCSGTAPMICVIGTLANGASATVTINLSSGAAGSLSLGGTVQGDYDTNTSNNTASVSVPVLEQNAIPPAPPPSSSPGTFNAVGTGTISVNGAVKPGDEQFVLNSGDVVDVGNGIITFTDSNGISGSWAKTRFAVARTTSHVVEPRLGIAQADDDVSSQFQVQQAASGGATTLTLVGGNFAGCSIKRALAATNTKPIRQLWGSAKGAFTTRGRFAAATVRGTFWLVQDRCDGTLTQVVEGVVEVLDTSKNKTVSVPAGSSYLAAPFTLPKQTAAQVKKRGVLFAGHTYKTRKTFEKSLKKAGWAWRDFAKKYPGLARALARRT